MLLPVVKPQLYPLRLFREDQANRKLLVSYYCRKRGRPVDFATILRELMAAKVAEISKRKTAHP